MDFGRILFQKSNLSCPNVAKRYWGKKAKSVEIRQQNSRTLLCFESDEAVIHLDFKTRPLPSNLSAPTPLQLLSVHQHIPAVVILLFSFVLCYHRKNYRRIIVLFVGIKVLRPLDFFKSKEGKKKRIEMMVRNRNNYLNCFTLRKLKRQSLFSFKSSSF